MTKIFKNYFINISDTTSVLAFILFCSIVFFYNGFFEGYEFVKLSIWYFGIGIFVLFIILRRQIKPIKYDTRLLLLSIILVLCLIISTVFSVDLYNSLFGFYPRYVYSFIFFITWLFLINYIAVEDDDVKKFFIDLMLVIGLLIGCFAIFQYFGFAHYGGTKEPVRAIIGSFLGNPNFAAMFVVTLVPLSFYKLFSTQNGLRKLYYFTCVILLHLSLVLFNSRGAIIALVISSLLIILFTLFTKQLLRSVFVMLFLCVFTALFFLFFQVSRINIPSTEAEKSNQNISNRILVWSESLDKAIERPFTGYGLGNFFVSFRENNQPAFANTEWFDDAHNFLINWLVNNGIPSTIALTVFLGFVIFTGIKAFRLTNDFRYIYLIAAIVSWLIAASFNPVSSSNWLLLGVLIACCWGIGTKQKLNIKNVKFIVTPFSIGLIVFALSMLISESLQLLGNNAYTFKNAALATKYYKASIIINPLNSNSRLAYANIMMEDLKIEEFNKQIKIYLDQHPYSSGLYGSAAQLYTNLYLKTSELDYKFKSFELFNKSIKLHNNFALLYSNAAQAALFMNDSELLRYYSIHAIVLNSESYAPWMYLAYFYYQNNDKDAMIYCLNRANKILPRQEIKQFISKVEIVDKVSELDFQF